MKFYIFKIMAVFFLVVYGVCSVGSAQSVRYDITKGEYKRKDEEKKYIVGKIVNIAEELQHRPSGADSQDSLFSKGRQGIMTSGGVLWTFVDNIKGQDLQWNKNYLNKFVKIHGWLYYDAQYVEVDQFSMDGVDYVWSSTTNVFQPVS